MKIKNITSLFSALIFTLLIFGEVRSFADQQIPFELQGVGIDDKTGQAIDLGLKFNDESGKSITLSDYFNNHRKPVILAMVYFGCPNLCTLVLNSTVDTLKQISLKAGQDFDVMAVSFDPHEKSDLAVNKKEAYLQEYYGLKENQKPDVAQNAGWHFLTGDQPAIAALTTQMGFRYKWDKEAQQYAHASAIFVMTPEGKVSRVFYGILHPPQDMKLALLEASKGKIGSVVDQLLLFCFHYDASSKKYVIMAQKMMKLGGAMALAVLVLFMALFWKKEIASAKRKKTKTTSKEASNVV